MATFKICVFEHQKRRDGKYPVAIRVTWKRQLSYIKTKFYVTDKQISKKDIKLEGWEKEKNLRAEGCLYY